MHVLTCLHRDRGMNTEGEANSDGEDEMEVDDDSSTNSADEMEKRDEQKVDPVNAKAASCASAHRRLKKSDILDFSSAW